MRNVSILHTPHSDAVPRLIKRERSIQRKEFRHVGFDLDRVRKTRRRIRPDWVGDPVLVLANGLTGYVLKQVAQGVECVVVDVVIRW